MAVWMNEAPRRPSPADMKQFRAGAHVADARRYEWLGEQLKLARRHDAAERAQQWAREHERLACDLLGIRGRDR